MPSQTFQQTIQTTMQDCLLKMAHNLADSFDADDPKSLRLLREFRSTLNAWKQWTKFAAANLGQAAGQAVQAVAGKPAAKKPAGNSSSSPNNGPRGNALDLSAFPANQETAALRQKLNQPTGLLCPHPV
ncbi:hypothetical protein GF373_05260 [bacterium]|nr:hypothetical protein [bacterium]